MTGNRYTLIIKGDAKIARPALTHHLPECVVDSIEEVTSQTHSVARVQTDQDAHQALGEWFRDDARAPFPPGSLLYYREGWM